MSDYVNPWLSLAQSEPEPYKSKRSAPKKLKAGDKVGRWTLIEYIGASTPNGRGRWRCACKCGSVKDVQANNLNMGHSTSCGCARLETLSGYGRGKSELARVMR
jgi:hypothetical protein